MNPLVIAELTVDVEFFGDEFVEHLLVAAAVGLGDLVAQFALAALQAVVFEGVESAFDLGGEGRIGGQGRVVEGLGEVVAKLVGGGRVERVGGCG